MQKVCFFIGNISAVGGTERVTSVIANELQARGYQIHILSLQCGDNSFFELDKSIHVSRLFKSSGSGTMRLPGVIFKLRRYLKKHEIDILVDVDSILTIYAIPAVVGLDIRHVCWEHFNYKVDFGKWHRRLARELAARFVDDVITLTERDRSLWLSNTTCRARVKAIPNPVTINISAFSDFKKEKVFLAVGRLTYQKGFDLLLNAWVKVSSAHPDWQLIIVGDGEDRDSLEEKRHDLNIEKSSEILPKTNEIAKYYNQAAFFVMSSRFEGLPLVLIEAQAHGLPIVSFDCDTGPAEIIKNNETGWLCEPMNIDSLSDGMIVAINQFEHSHQEYLKQVGRAADNSKRFRLNEISDLWCDLFRTYK